MPMATTPYATVVDYEGLFGPVADESLLSGKLVASSTVIDAELAARDRTSADIDDGLLRLVCCQMAERTMPKGGTDVPAGVTSLTETVGPYSHSFGFSAPYGSPKLLEDELRLLLGSGTGARMGFATFGGTDG